MSMHHSDFNFKQRGEIKERFTREYAIPGKAEKASEKDFQDFSDNPLQKSMEKRMALSARDVFSEKYTQDHMNDDNLERNVVRRVEGVYRAKSWGLFEKTKRVSEAKDRIKLQHYIVDEEKAVVKAHKNREKHWKDRVSKYHLDKIKENFINKDERDAAMNWMIGEQVYKKDGSLSRRSFFESMTVSAGNGRKAVLDSIPGVVKKVDFSYGNDKEFAERYGEKYDLLCRIVSAEAFLNNIGDVKDLEDYRGTKAAIELCKDIREHYDAKAKLMKSPYYALTRDEDIRNLTDGHGHIYEDRIRDPKYIEYLRDYFRLRSQPIANGVKQDLEEKKLSVMNFVSGDDNDLIIHLRDEEYEDDYDDEAEENIISTDTKEKLSREKALLGLEGEKNNYKEVVSDILDRRDLKKNVREDKRMKDLGTKMEKLTAYLGQKMPPISKKESRDYVEFADAVDAGCLIATTFYNEVLLSIRLCLDNPESFSRIPEVKKQLETAEKMIKRESDLFRHKVLEYREMVSGAPEVDKEDEEPTWMMALKYERADSIDLDDKKKYRAEKVGGATSTRLKITKFNDEVVKEKQDESEEESFISADESYESGEVSSDLIENHPEDEQVFFQKTEKVAPSNNITMIREFISEMKEDKKVIDRTLKPAFEALIADEEQGINVAMYSEKGQLTGVYNPVEFIHKNVKQQDVVLFNLLMEEHSLSLGRFIRKMNPLDYGILASYLHEFAKRLFQRRQCQNIDIKPDSNISDRNVATTRMAQLFGMQDMICNSRTAVVKQKGAYVKGCIMDAAKGVLTSDVITAELDKKKKVMKRQVQYADSAIAQIFSLQVFDLICGQVDRHRGNFFVQSDDRQKEGTVMITSLMCFDNDMSFGAMPFSKVEHGYNRIAEPDDENLKALPIRMINTIMHLSRHALDYLLSDILSVTELNAMWSRISGIRSRIEKLDGIRYDEKTTRYYFEGEDADDSIRQLKMLRQNKVKYLMNRDYGKRTPFNYAIVDVEDLDSRLTQKRAKRGKKVK